MKTNIDKVLDILREDLLIEMATIGEYDQHFVSVYTEPLGNPSFHVRKGNEWEVVLRIKDFSILEVKHGKFKKGQHLPTYELKSLRKFLMNPFEELKDITNWKFLLVQWNVLNPKYKIDSENKMP